MSEIYDVVLQKKITGPDPRVLRKDITMPFPPYPDLYLDVGSLCCQIQEVLFDVYTCKFNCHVEPLDTIALAAQAHANRTDAPAVDDLIKELTEEGWELAEGDW